MRLTGDGTMDTDVSQFYDAFGDTFVRDLVRGNQRVDAVHRFFREAIPPEAGRILLIGCGSGRDAWELAKRVAPAAKVLAVDISENNIRMARALHSHPHVSYRRADVLEDEIQGTWPYIVLPDVYEHIPKPCRGRLHERLRKCLTDDGRILLTCPTPWHQDMLRQRGAGLQIVDENVSLADVQQLADAVGGFVGFFRTVSIWNANDYFHAVIERRAGTYPLDAANRVPSKGVCRPRAGRRLCDALRARCGLRALARRLRASRIERKLRHARIAPAKQAGEE